MSNRRSGNGDCICFCGIKPNSTSSTSYGNAFCKDHLHNWEVWMRRRKQVHNRLEKIGRNPGMLLMNINEEVRNIKEDQLMLQYLQIETNFDKYRGNPAFFKLPVALSTKKNTSGKLQPTYFTTMTKEEKNEIPDIEYVTVPEKILIEKDIMPRDRNLYESWKIKSKYRMHKILSNLEKVKTVQPHKPELNELIIIGKSIDLNTKEIGDDIPLEKNYSSNSNKQLNTLKTTYIHDDDNSEFKIGALSQKRTSFELQRQTYFKINHVEFYANSPSLTYCKAINIFFDRDSEEIIPTENTILIENLGTTTLRLYWKEYKKNKLFREFTNLCPISNNFKFVKNELLLLPNENIKFPVWFTCKEPGGYQENWEITSLPKIFDTDYHLVISLKGFVYVKNFEYFSTTVASVLDTKVTHNIVKDILDEVVKRGNYCSESYTVSQNFSEKQLFESQNLENKILISAVKYIYDKDVVNQLKCFYKEIRQHQDPDEWNLSIKYLKKLARQKDILIYAKETSIEHVMAQSQRKVLEEKSDRNLTKKPKVVEQEEKVVSAKSSVVKNLKGGSSNTNNNEESVKISYYTKLKNILEKLLKPAMIEHKERTKYMLCFLVIKTYLIKTCTEIEFVDTKCYSFPLKNSAPSEIQLRLLFETFNESYIQRTKRISPEEADVSKFLPKTSLLKDIPLDDAKRVYKIYFGKEVFDDKGKKKSKGKTDEKSTKVSQKTTPSKDKKEKINVSPVLLEMREDFHPFLGEFDLLENIVEDVQPKTSRDITHFDDKSNYDEKYLIVYLNLCEAIDTLVDTIEFCKTTEVSSNVLSEMEKCNLIDPSVFVQNEESFVEEASPSKSENISRKASIKKVIDKTRSATATAKASDSAHQTIKLTIDDEYTEYLVESHLIRNALTKKYVVNEEKSALTNQNIKPHSEISLGRVLSNVFSLTNFKRASVPFGYTDVEAQTSCSKVELMEDLQKYLEITDSYIPKIFSMEDNNEVPQMETLPKKSSDIFYFLNDVKQEDNL